MSRQPGSTTPIISGFYPDPSVCRVGADYFLVASSFELFPGVPIFQSTDLVSWTQIGNVLDRTSQLALTPMSDWIAGGPYRSDGVAAAAGVGSDGVYAATIRHHDGRFWVTTTVANSVARGPLIVNAERPEGPWSDPVHIDGLVGIDSDLFWDEGGRCYMTLSSYASGRPRILTVLIDPATGEVLDEPIELWSGTGGVAPEAPHLYRKDGLWYLLLAEGGTGAAHAVTLARASELRGPWEPHPQNPILSHRGVDHPVQYTGHGDLVETAHGEWAMVYLGVRLRGFPGFHVNGRETFIAGVEWREGWPYVIENSFELPDPDNSFEDDLSRGLDSRWVTVRTGAFDCLVPSPSGMVMTSGEDAWSSFIGVRTRDELWQVEVDVAPGSGVGSLTVRLSDDHFLDIRASAVGLEVVAMSAGLGRRDVFTMSTPEGSVRLFARAVPAGGVIVHLGPDVLEVGHVEDGIESVLFRLDGRHLSTEVAGGFTGRLVGVRALSGDVGVRNFSYVAGSRD